MNETDFSPILNQLIQLAALIISGVVIWLGVQVRAWIAAKTGLKDSQLADSIQQRFNEAVVRSMAYAESAAKTAIPKGGKIEIDQPFVRAAADYLVKMWPELTKDLDDKQIADAIVARLPSGPMTEQANAITVAKAGAAVPAPEPAK